MTGDLRIRPARPEDEAAAYRICLATGDAGRDGAALYRDDPEALGRIYVGPYFAFEPALCLVLEDDGGVCGYALGALSAPVFFRRYDAEWRPGLCRRFPCPQGDPDRWTPVQRVHARYHDPAYPPRDAWKAFPSHLHIDLLPRIQGCGQGRSLLAALLAALRRQGSPGVHLAMNAANTRALGFYRRLGFAELGRRGTGAGECLWLGRRLDDTGEG